MDLYHETILEHYKDPQHYGLLAKPTHQRAAVNPTCGDQFTFTALVDENGTVQDIGFEGEGCAISTATASLLSEYCVGKTLEEVQSITQKHVLDLLGIELSPTRLKCALLPMEGITGLQVISTQVI